MRRSEPGKKLLRAGQSLTVAFLLLGGLTACDPRDDATRSSGLAETNSQAAALEQTRLQPMEQSPGSTGDSGRRESKIQPAQSSPSPDLTIAGKGELSASNLAVEIQRAAVASKKGGADGADVVTERRVKTTAVDGHPVTAGGIVAGSGAEKRDSSSPQPETSLLPAEPIVANNNAVAGNGGGSTQAVTEVKPEEPPTPAVLVSRHVMVGTSNQVIVSYSMELNRTINESATGMVLSQILPRGWSLVQSKPQPSSFDAKSRVAKWLLLPDQIQMNAVELFAVSDDKMASPSVWNEAICWYTYRQASDGRSMTFNAETR